MSYGPSDYWLANAPEHPDEDECSSLENLIASAQELIAAAERHLGKGNPRDAIPLLREAGALLMEA